MFGVDEGPEAVAPIRALRANPPGRARDGRRGKTFGAALEQFEQLLAAGSRAAPATAPIPLFYALSQAGRAILAARAAQPWEVHGHGVGVRTRRDPIGETEVSPYGDGLFQAVALATGSRPLERTLTLGEIWGSIPALPRARQLGDEAPTIFMVGREPPDGRRRVVRDDRGRLLRDPAPFTERGEGFPEISGEVSVQQQGEYSVVAIEFSSDLEVESFDAVLWEYLDQPYLRSGPPMPSGLMLWWLLLQALSHLARYEPAGWLGALAPDVSELAVPIERTIRRAVALLPLLVLNALTDS